MVRTTRRQAAGRPSLGMSPIKPQRQRVAAVDLDHWHPIVRQIAGQGRPARNKASPGRVWNNSHAGSPATPIACRNLRRRTSRYGRCADANSESVSQRSALMFRKKRKKAPSPVSGVPATLFPLRDKIASYPADYAKRAGELIAHGAHSLHRSLTNERSGNGPISERLQAKGYGPFVLPQADARTPAPNIGHFAPRGKIRLMPDEYPTSTRVVSEQPPSPLALQ